MSATPSIGRMLKQCPAIYILVTSQKLLGVDGEQQIEVHPMARPAARASITPELLAQLDSFRLFQERAKLKEPGWDVAPVEASLVAEILELTDGIPLSIELTAGWVGEKALAEIRDGLKNNRSDYLRRSGPGIQEKRHASMQACIDWSFKLLSREEQALFPQLSVFVGGFFADDVAQVCQVKNADSLLNSLHGHSLLLWEEAYGKTRYRMLPTVQEYATARVQKRKKESDELRHTHAQHYLRVLDEADDQIRGKEQMAGINCITADLDNIRQGMENTIKERDHRTVVKYSQAFGTYLSMKARFAELLLRTEQGLSAAQVLRDFLVIAGCQNNLGTAYRNLPTGDRGENLKKAIDCFEAALRVYTEKDFPVQWATTQNNLGNVYAELPTGDRGENLKKAIACYEAALRVYTEKDFPVQWATTQNNLGNAYTQLPTGDRGENLKKAVACYEAAIRGFEATGLTKEAERVKRLLVSLQEELSS